MIPYKNIFAGSLGMTKKPGGSPFMTTPHTRALNEPSYTISLDISGEFICCTLNGRLWVYRTGEGQYSLVALKWDETEGKLEYAASLALSGEEAPVARGIDWILLSNLIIQPIETAPYILKEELFNQAQGGRFCYSLLRSQILAEIPSGMSVTLGPGIDPFTLKAWGMDNTNGNTEGWAYFNTNLAGLYPKGTHAMEACYSTLPSVGDWNIVEDFLVRRPEKATEDDSGDEDEEEMEPIVEANPYHSFMKQVRPLIPLEFNWYSQNVAYPTYGTGYSVERRGVQLSSCAGELWGRGLMHLGRAFILPAAFDESGQPQEFYLYIDPSGGKGPYNQAANPNLDEADPWLSVGVAALRDTSDNGEAQEWTTQPVGFVSEKGEPLKSGICRTAATSEILISGGWINPRPDDEGKIAFDAMNGTGLALGRKGVTFFSGDTGNSSIATSEEYSCQGMSEWLAPAAQLESIGQDRVLSSFDTGLLMTNIPTGFDRLLLSRRALPLAWGIFEGKDSKGNRTSRARLSLGKETYQNPASGNAAQITVNEIACPDDLATPVANIPWNDVYREAANIRLLNCAEGIEVESFCDYGPLFISKRDIQEKEKYDSWYGEYFSWPVRAYYELYFIHPDTGELTPGVIDIDLTPYYDYEPDPERADGVDYVWPVFPTVRRGILGIALWRYIHYRIYGGPTYDGGTVFLSLESLLPAWWTKGAWTIDAPPGLKLEQKLFVPSAAVPLTYPWDTTKDKISLPPESPCYPHLAFSETSTGTKLLMKAPSFGSLSADGSTTGVLNHILDKESDAYFGAEFKTYTNSPVKDFRGKDKGTKNLHVCATCNWTSTYDDWTGIVTTNKFNNRLFVIRADLDPDTFDFDAELIKSKMF